MLAISLHRAERRCEPFDQWSCGAMVYLSGLLALLSEEEDLLMDAHGARRSGCRFP